MGNEPASDQPGPPSAMLDRRYLWVILACAAAMAVSEAFTARHVTIPSSVFLPLHLALEFSSVVVCFAVFATAWFGYKRDGGTRDLIVSVTFLGAGLSDFVHTLVYKGMPSFLELNGVGEAAVFWLLGRMLVGLGLLAAALTARQTHGREFRPWVAVSATVGLVAAFTAAVAVYPGFGALMFSEQAGGLTPLKIGLEYFVIALYAATFLALSEKRGWGSSEILRLRTAMILAIFAELALTLYTNPYAIINAVGHLFKMASYYLILTALFVTALQRPYEELSRALHQLQELYDDAKQHRREIEQSFTRIGSALSSSLKINEALDRIAELVDDMLHSDCTVVVTPDRAEGSRRVVAQRGGCHDERRPRALALKISDNAALERRSIVVNNLPASELVVCHFDDPRCLKSMLCSPMIHEDRVLGAVTIFSYETDAFNEGDVKLLEAFAIHAAVAIDNAISFERESRIAHVLQKSFVFPFPVKTDNFEITHVYHPATDESLVGGDFYDVIDMHDGRFGLVIGDVSGKGLKAAVHTAMVKYALRAYVYEGRSPAEAMHLLDEMVGHTDGDSFITMFFGILDPRDWKMTYVNAGHEPALYVRDNVCAPLDSTGPALGFGLEMGYVERRVTLEKGSVLLLYTDGITEARKNGILLGEERLEAELMACVQTDCDNIAEQIHACALEFADKTLQDDVAILAVRRLG